MASINNKKNDNFSLNDNDIMNKKNFNNFLKINLNNSDRIIKFRSLNKDQNFIFIKIKNTINIYELVRFNLAYTFHLNEEIVNFEISPLDSSVILNTMKNLQIHSLNADNLEDYSLKINYKLSIIKEYERIENLTISSLGDIIATLDSFHIIKILNRKLEVLQTIKNELKFFHNWPSSNFNLNISTDYFLENLNLHYFMLTYDTKNICLSKFGENNISFIYKNIKYSPVKNLFSTDETNLSNLVGYTNILSPETKDEFLENCIKIKMRLIQLFMFFIKKLFIQISW